MFITRPAFYAYGTHEYKLESKTSMLNLFKSRFLTHFWYLNVENDTKGNQVIYYFIYYSIVTQYCLSITKKWVE